jgi:hypothetical protein
VSDPRDLFVSSVVQGRSFADVGGLWGTVSEKVSVAHAAGAASLAMIDISSRDDRWDEFDARRRSLGVPEVRTVRGDIQELVDAMPDLRFDVVHCSGVLYHLPEPYRLLRALRRASNAHVVLASTVTATTIVNDAGRLEVPEGSALFVPALTPAERAIVGAHWRPYVGDNALGLTRDVASWSLSDFGPWWWLPTPRALATMCETAGFRVRDQASFWDGNSLALLLETPAGGRAS